MLDKLAGALKNAAKEKTKSLVKKIFTGSVPTLVVLIGGACTVTALVGAIVGIVSAVVSPFTNKYQKDAAYTQISSYGGAYKALDDGLLAFPGPRYSFRVGQYARVPQRLHPCAR